MPVQHLVFLKLDPAKDALHVMAVLRALVGVIPGLLSFSGGENTSQEGLSQGFTHAFSMLFESPASRDAYLPHPAHEAAKAIVIASLASANPEEKNVCVVDFTM
jgi:hypothetical protein